MTDTVGKRLKGLRLSSRLSQEQVARLLDVSKNAISQYERDLRQPSYDTLLKLASIYHTNVDYLLGNRRNFAIDVSELNDDEINIITGLVTNMAEKNKLLAQCGNSVGGG